jgi:hypothetical protein
MLNLYEILKEVLLTESVTSDYINDAIDGKYRILINYDDEKYHATGSRLVEPYAIGYTSAGNLAFRGYQYEGDTVRGIPKWKLFRLDRVINFEPTKQKFNVEPRENGWNAEPYNKEGDGSLVQILNQVVFDKNNGLFSPHNRLNILRRRTDNMKDSTPINASQMQNQPKPNDSGPITNNVTNSVSKQNSVDLQRNLEITRKEKERKGFSLSKDGVKRGPIDTQQNTPTNNNTETNQEIVNQQDNNNNVENNKSDLQKLLDRNLEITRKEKAKRGFSLSDKNLKNGKRR